MKTIGDRIKHRPWLGWVLFISTMIIVFLLGVLTYSIVERRTAGEFAYAITTDIDRLDPRAEAWGRYFPRQFNTYAQMADTTFRSKYLGSQRRDLLDVNPRMVILFAGYGFSRDYNLSRGHYYSVQDVRETLRTGAPMKAGDGPQPATCWTCKSPDVVRLIDDMGAGEFYSLMLSDTGHEIANPINCASCHEAEDMSLKIALPALAETFARMGQDVSGFSHQQMRSLTCAQCHVEYYFGENNYLIFPWDEGMTAEDMARYFDKRGFADWIHPLSKAPMIKAQHPDYEVFTTGIHYQRGVSCADCHMPYKTEGGMKFTDHKIQSPLNNIAAACQTCHRQSEAELIRNVYDRQDMIYEIRTKLEDVLVKTHLEAEFAWKLGATEEQMSEALHLIRHAQWRWDYAAATHGGSFHAPLELARTIGNGLDLAHEARRKITAVLVELGHTGDVPLPDVSTKEKAQKYIGIDLEQLEANKERFLVEIVPEWLRLTAERQQRWDEQRRDPDHEGSYIQ
ncbi:MAG: ammonia-forming cytochrome c nitrite reductase subunit c552 [Balneolaceae bacterium]|nr:MAG: ammonia-forming cytochrome c nitrite reductase subunit c552 [Balneolaceae bacterium]